MIDVIILLARIAFYGLLRNWLAVLIVLSSFAAVAAMVHFSI